MFGSPVGLDGLHTFLEFFAGGGMARAGLGPGWKCLFANDIDPKKAATYRRNWGAEAISVTDVALLSPRNLPTSAADLAWASFPCQDLSLAGGGAGLNGARSGAFWHFWQLIQALNRESRAPGVVVLENVCGALTSHKSADFRSLTEALRIEGYRCGALVIDAALFLPHSRPRLFVIAVRTGTAIPANLLLDGPQPPFHTGALRAAHASLHPNQKQSWLWWNLPVPKRGTAVLAELIEDNPSGVKWHTMEQTNKLLDMMSPLNLARIEGAKRMKRRVIGCLYRRTRATESGAKAQRAEVRFDGVAGCLRPPNGGSSRQTIVVVEGDSVKSRLLSPRETARLMGLPDAYKLPANCNEAYHVTGDGVAVPVVRHLAEHVLEPLALEPERRPDACKQKRKGRHSGGLRA